MKNNVKIVEYMVFGIYYWIVIILVFSWDVILLLY